MADDPRTTEALTAAQAVRAVVRECRLVRIDDDGRDGAAFLFAAERMVIGADPVADLVIGDAAMSKFHCEIRIRDGAAVIRDLGSRNGTLVDRVPVIEAPLRDGAVLALGRTQLRFHVGTRQVEIPLSQRERFGRLIGRSAAMRASFVVLEAAAASTSTVLLQGESGTGKDLAAESIHLEGARRDGPFVVIDCAAIPASLLEAELFGYEAGAFTGATAQRIGAFEAAAGGTILLDEIGELALDLQPKLLRAIERREIQRIGSTQRIATDARIIAATNRNLRQEVNARRFRSDLYFRLAVLVVTLPPLRDRTPDLPLLVAGILDDLRAGDSAMARALRGGELLPELLRHGWPGNVRELRNYVEACLVRQDHAGAAVVTGVASEPIGEPAIDIALPLREVRERWVRHVERRYLEQLLVLHANNVSAAARAAGIDRVHFHRLLARVGLR
ncbi:MAG TPA: sigma 54-interacting transcriptional regulator [Kofleriaceae bacterium]|nr:sigma 54-interacting transcriptional regulator [Kofleriaceae bacterium]